MRAENADAAHSSFGDTNVNTDVPFPEATLPFLHAILTFRSALLTYMGACCRGIRSGKPTLYYRSNSAICLRGCYAMPGTERVCCYQSNASSSEAYRPGQYR
eukprot:109443-Rhodomonas_salina.2